MTDQSDTTKTAILLLGYGTPDTLEDIPEFYANIRSGRPVSQTIVDQLITKYQKIGGRSPLLTITQSVKEKLAEAVQLPVYLGMLYWKPYIREAIEQIAYDEIDHVIVICLTPHYSQLSIGIYKKHLDQAIQMVEPGCSFTFIQNWHNHAEYISGIIQNIRRAIADLTDDKRETLAILYSAHSLPTAIIQQGDPYAEQIHETASLITEQLNLAPRQTTVAYQSSPRKDGTWLNPDIETALMELAHHGTQAVVVVPIGFVIDNMEILYDIDIELNSIAESQNLYLIRPQLLNDSPPLIATLKSLVQQHLENIPPRLKTSSIARESNDLK